MSAAVSLRAYSRHRGVTLRAVQRAIAAGRITPLPDGRIDAAVADQQWEANTLYPSGDSGVGASHEFRRARTVREHFAAKITRIEYEERTGKVVPVADVQAAAFNRFRRFRDAMISIPDRIAAIVAAEPNEAICHGILKREIERALVD